VKILTGLLASSCLLICSISAVWAQSVSTRQPAETPSAVPAELEEVTVTAQRRAENLMKVPVSITAISGSQLEAQQINNAEDLRRAVPGLIATPSQAGRNDLAFNIRGLQPVNSQGVADPTVGVYVDGLYYGRTRGANAALIDIQQVEVLNGPQGTLFGKNTTGGAVTITTNKPVDDFEGSMRVGAGNYGEKEATFVVNAPIDSTASVRLAYGHVQHDGYDKNRYLNLPNDDLNQDFARVTLRWNPTSNLDILQSVDYTNINAHAPSDPLVYVSSNPALIGGVSAANRALLNQYFALEGGPGNQFRDNYSFIDPLQKITTWDYTGTITANFAWVTVKSITGYRDINSDVASAHSGIPAPVLNDFPVDVLNSHQFTQELQAYGDAFANRLSWIVGAFFIDENIGPNGAISQVQPSSCSTSIPGAALCYSAAANQDIINRSDSAFGQLTYEIFKNVKLTGGLRYVQDNRGITWVSESTNYLPNSQYQFVNAPAGGLIRCNPSAAPFGDTPTAPASVAHCSYSPANFKSNFVPWTLGLSYTPNDDLLLYGKVSTGYRSGEFQTSFVATPKGDTPYAPPAPPEKNETYEVGIKANLFDDHARVQAAIYRSMYDNMHQTLVQTFPGDSAVRSFLVNGGSAHITGGELQATALLGDLKLNATLGIVSGKIVAGPFTGVPFFSGGVTPPEYQWSAGGSYHLQMGRPDLELHLDYAWQSRTIFYSQVAQVTNTTPNPALVNCPQVVGSICFYVPEMVAAITQRAYGVMNGRMDFHPSQGSKWEISLWSRNLLNQFYYSRGGSDYSKGYDASQPGVPRTFGASLEYRF
jgi:iron complex outermembrane receptor protein